MARHIRCGMLFTALSDQPEKHQTVVLDAGRIAFVGPTSAAPPVGPTDVLTDHSDKFVMPGLIDNHVHLSYGEARTEEDIDLYASLEFRALRGMDAAQRVLKAGFTSMLDPTTSGRVSLAIRDAVLAGLFVGPRITCSGANISSRQGLVDWYPTWIGVPTTSIGAIVRSPAEAIETIRCQVKDGVDVVKLAMDGDAMNPASIRLAAAFSQDEVTAMVNEAHRLGRKVIVHARGSEGVLYAARARADLIFHASWMDERALEAVIAGNCTLCPTLSLLVNNIEFARASDGSYPSLRDAHRRELEAAVENLSRARKAGVRFMIGSEAGFAVTPYGEWNARELENHVKYLGFRPAEVLRQATSVNATFLREGTQVGALERGRLADVLILKRDPIADITCLQDPESIADIYLGGEPVDLTPNVRRSRLPMEFSYNMWNDVYTRTRVKELRARS